MLVKSLKIVSINIEGQKHLKTVAEFLAKERPDVVCLMEICEEDVLKIAGDKYPDQVYASNDILTDGLTTGVAILSKNLITASEKYYCGEDERVYKMKPGMGTHVPALVLVQIGSLQIGAIHFTWTPKGRESEEQKRHLAKLLEYTADKEMVMCGDFNIPRGNSTYSELLKHFKDNIPGEIESTLDPVLHYGNREEVGKLKLVVDYVWSTPKYKVSKVRVVPRVSDHCAIVAQVDKLI